MTGEDYQNEKIKTLRKAAGLRQAQLAALVGVHKMTVVRVEAGGNCSFELIKKIASVFQVDWRDILRPEPIKQKRSKKSALDVDLVSI